MGQKQRGGPATPEVCSKPDVPLKKTNSAERKSLPERFKSVSIQVVFIQIVDRFLPSRLAYVLEAIEILGHHHHLQWSFSHSHGKRGKYWLPHLLTHHDIPLPSQNPDHNRHPFSPLCIPEPTILTGLKHTLSGLTTDLKHSSDVAPWVT